METLGLYVHIPFCHVKCRFCDFAAYPGMLREIPRYLFALELELARHRGKTIDTLYIGGGTPTVLNSQGLSRVFNAVRKNLLLAAPVEVTVECNPESTTPEKLRTLKGLGANRLSFGLQATQDSLLRALGRLHDFEAFSRAFKQARATDFRNINIDLMYGLPGQTLRDWRETVEKVLEFDPEHISAYALTVSERTAFGKSGIVPDSDLQAQMYEWLSERLRRAGYEHYEISNFAKPGFECRHNIRYWKNQPCLGVGVSAAGYEDGLRRTNTSKLEDYIRDLERGKRPVAEEVRLEEPERLGEDLMLALRLKRGTIVTPETQRLYGPVLDKYSDLGFLRQDARIVKPTLRGWLLSNQMFKELLTPEQ